MTGAAHLAAGGAQRAGAGIVWLSSPGVEAEAPPEVVRRRLPAFDWTSTVLAELDRFHALVLGPGLGREDYTVASVRATLIDADVPVVLDGDGLFAASWNADGSARVLRRRRAPTVLTPHDGEYGLLAGHRPGPDRIAAARELAAATASVVLLKGPATVVAEPRGRVLISTMGDERLATAGSGDVLSGIIGALLAQQLPAFEAAAVGAWLHGAAGMRGASRGLVASDLPALLPGVLESL
jgi:NAD(P)H-hydrate epimerase